MQKTLGRYQIQGELGSGGQSVVFRGWDPVINRPVAIKQVKGVSELPPNRRERFLARFAGAGSYCLPRISSPEGSDPDTLAIGTHIQNASDNDASSTSRRLAKWNQVLEFEVRADHLNIELTEGKKYDFQNFAVDPMRKVAALFRAPSE